MKLKKFIIVFLIILIICMCIIFTGIYFLNDKDEIENKYNLDKNIVPSDSINEGRPENQIEEDMNVVGDWEYSDEIRESVENIIINTETQTESEERKSWEDTVTQEDIDNYKFEVSYNNIPQEILEHINRCFEDFDRSLKEYCYINGFAAASKAEYSYYRTVNSGNTIMIYFNLNDYYKNVIEILINLDDYSYSISRE